MSDPQNLQPEEPLSIAEAAQALGVTETRLRRLLTRPEWQGRTVTVTVATVTGTRSRTVLPVEVLEALFSVFHTEDGENGTKMAPKRPKVEHYRTVTTTPTVTLSNDNGNGGNGNDNVFNAGRNGFKFKPSFTLEEIQEKVIANLQEQLHAEKLRAAGIEADKRVAEARAELLERERTEWRAALEFAQEQARSAQATTLVGYKTTLISGSEVERQTGLWGWLQNLIRRKA